MVKRLQKKNNKVTVSDFFISNNKSFLSDIVKGGRNREKRLQKKGLQKKNNFFYKKEKVIVPDKVTVSGFFPSKNKFYEKKVLIFAVDPETSKEMDRETHYKIEDEVRIVFPNKPKPLECCREVIKVDPETGDLTVAFYKIYHSFYQKRCSCTKKKNKKKRELIFPKQYKEKSVLYPGYPGLDKLEAQTFQIKYEKNLSPVTRLLLHSFQHKYLYYAIEDILNLFKSDPIEQNNVLAILYSPVLSLQNNKSIDFFNIWIDKVYISKEKIINKFLSTRDSNFGSASYITIRFLYKPKILVKKQKILW